ncbi:NAD(P)H-dependent glycerol-3-phosphate dehydrogenase [Helicobacter sp. faydin-H20]|uniref:NAD(P)H-dependent glycerol-3-phosphate dehydrogenase n=1 Tax=Helicobacter anatolicus TaxID=2905874 RepID=UPI001E2E9223|nr:NAD(P)H-dependent glycerol-3-phosphate dehydrogenase [Helicobacter anatolicus]MCE3037425.1 NAD(P)H-dependent glycerol-3-phosphate dehydrogenase [Helicobacter anatolicus]
MRIAVFGGGAWGRALAFALSHKNEVFIVSRQNLKEKLSLLQCPSPVLQVDFQESLKADLFVNAITTSALRGWFESCLLPKNIKMLFACKGIEVESGAFVSDIAQEFLDSTNLCFLAGPSFAAEVLQGQSSALSIHSNNKEVAKIFAQCMPDFIKTYIEQDVIGGEIAGAYKNVIAIASGICDGLQLGNNARASLLARGLVEMHRFGAVFGARMETFLGLSGAGDLFLTASSKLSRNYRVGIALAQNKDIEEILFEIGEVAEGVKTTEALVKIAEKKGIYIPIAQEIFKILKKQSSPQQSLRNLMC